VAEAIRTEKTTLLDVKQIDVFGTIDGRQYEFGPIFVTTHISRPECLVVVPNSLEFLSEKETGAITKELKVKNTCAEEVRVRLIEPREFDSNSLDLAFPDEVVPPGSDRPIQIILTKNVFSKLRRPKRAIFSRTLIFSSLWIRKRKFSGRSRKIMKRK